MEALLSLADEVSYSTHIKSAVKGSPAMRTLGWLTAVSFGFKGASISWLHLHLSFISSCAHSGFWSIWVLEELPSLVPT